MSRDRPGKTPRASVPASRPGVGRIDVSEARARLTAFVEATVEATDATGVVVNLSGGLDSTVTATLAVEALDVSYDAIHLQPLMNHVGDLAPERVDLHGDPIVSGNLVARLRMTMAYLTANATGRLVVGTTNRSELLLGYFTKYGDGASDLLPIGDLYKTEVERLARDLGVPEFVLEKPPTAGFWPGQSDERDLGAPYEVIDAVLSASVDDGLDEDEIRERIDCSTGLPVADVSTETIARIYRHVRRTDHKRALPPTPGL